MRLVLRFEPKKGVLILPIHYNHLIQGMIYRTLDKSLRLWLHDEGFIWKKRKFKLFTFSRILSKRRHFNPDDRTISFYGPILLKISSLETKILESLAVYLVKNRDIQLNGTPCYFNAIEVEMPIRVGGPIKVRTLSPITVYRTLYTIDGSKKTYYYTPYEDEFEELLLDNLRRKAKAYEERAGEKLPPLKEGGIKPIKVGRQVIIRFKGTVVKGWTGIFEVNLPEPYFTLAYDAGLGSKNSQGFGMIEVVARHPQITTQEHQKGET